MRRILIGFILALSAALLSAAFVFRPSRFGTFSPQAGRFLVSFFGERPSPSFSSTSTSSVAPTSSSPFPTPNPTSTSAFIPSVPTSSSLPTSSLPKPPKPKPPVSDNDKYEACQTSFTLVSLYVYTPESLNQDHLERLIRYHPIFERVLNKAGRGRMTFSFYEPAVIPFEIKDEEKDEYLVFVNYPKEGRKEVAGFNARTIIQEIYNRYPPGSFDFVNLFSDMPEYTGSSQYIAVQNRIENAGDSPHTGAYGYGDQGGRLLGVSFIKDLQYLPSRIAFRKETDEQIACGIGDTIAHETTHRWSAKVGDNETDPNALMPMRRYDGFHWSYGLNIGYDPVGGARWQDNKDGTFTLPGPEEWCALPTPGSGSFLPRLGFPRMSDITLYLAGAMKKEEVKPMTWIDFNPADVPNLWEGYTFRPQHTKTITIEDIVKKYGEVRCVKEETLKRTIFGE